MFKYLVDAVTYEVKVWTYMSDILVDKPFLYQPNSPNGEDWLSYEEAYAWVNEFIVSIGGIGEDQALPTIPEEPIS